MKEIKNSNKIVLFNTLSTVVIQGITFITAPIFSRLLGTYNYGIVSIFHTWAAIIAIVFPLQTTSTLAVAKKEFAADNNKYQSSVMFLSVASYLLFSIAVIIFIKPVSYLLNMDKSLIYFMLLYGFGVFCISFINTKFTYEFKADKNSYIAITNAILSTALSIVLVNLLSSENNYWGRVLGQTIISFSIAIVIVIYILRNGRTLYNKKYWSFCLQFAIPVIFHNLSGQILNQSDRVMIQRMCGNSDTGIYSLAYSFSSVISVLWNALNNSWVPFFYEYLGSGDVDSLKKRAKNYTELFTVLTVGFMLLVKDVYRIFASSEYWDGINLIYLIAVGYYFVFLYSFPINFEFYNKKTKTIAYGTSIVAILNIVLNYFLISYIGYNGAAIATAVSYFLLYLFHHYNAKRIVSDAKYPFRFKMFIPGILIVVFSAVIISALDNYIIIRWIFAIIIGVIELARIYKRKMIF